MAKEYIERAEAKEELLSWARCIKHPEHLLTEDAMCVLDNIPAADVVEVVHGRWEDKPNPQWKAYDIRHCSVCGWSIHKSKLRNADLNWHYCPNCGSRMDLKGE